MFRRLGEWRPANNERSASNSGIHPTRPDTPRWVLAAHVQGHSTIPGGKNPTYGLATSEIPTRPPIRWVLAAHVMGHSVIPGGENPTYTSAAQQFVIGQPRGQRPDAVLFYAGGSRLSTGRKIARLKAVGWVNTVLMLK